MTGEGKRDDRPLEVAFCASGDPTDVTAFSGVLFHMMQALKAEFPALDVVRHVRPHWYGRLYRVVFRLGRGRIDPTFWRPFNAWFARALARRWRGRRVVVVAPVSATITAELGRYAPVINVSDSTFALMRSFYQLYATYDAGTARTADAIERRAIRNAVHNSFSSAWAARSAVEDYGAAPEDVSVASWGCNLAAVPAPSDWRPTGGPCRLLFMGGDWTRKGGDIAVDAVRRLQARGIACTLDLVGAKPPEGEALPDGVHVHGFLSKADPDQLVRIEGLYRDSHFLLAPTRQDCTPMIFAETNAYGMPAATRDVGGVGSLVEDGVNGLLLPADATAGDFADAVARAWTDADGYRRLRGTARATYEQRLNWPAWARALAGVIAKLEDQRRI